MAFVLNWPAFGGTDPNASVPFPRLVAGLGMVGLAAAVCYLSPEESLALAAGLLVLLLALADLRWGFLTFVALYPLMPYSWGIDLAGWMPYLTAKRLCCLALALTFAMRAHNPWDTPRVRKIGLFLLVLLAVQMLAGFGSRDPMGAFKRTFGDAVEYYLPFLMAAHLFRTKAQVRTLVTLVLLSMGVAAFLALIEHTVDYNFYDSFVATRADIQEVLTDLTELYRGRESHARRVRVAFYHPIEMGLHLMCALMLVIYLLHQRRLLRRAVLLGSLPLFVLALLYTYSRGPLVGLICGIAWLGLIGRGTRSLLPVVLLCGIGTYLLMPAPAREILQETIVTSTDLQTGYSIGGGTVRARLNMLQAGLQFSQQSLWFGLGPGEVQQHKSDAGRGGTVDFSTVDNYYLQLLLRHGAMVLILMVGFYFYLVGLFTRAARRLPDREMALLAAMGAGTCIANFVALTTVGINITLFWIILGPVVRACDGSDPDARGRGVPGPLRDLKEVLPMATRSQSSDHPFPVPTPAGARRCSSVLALGTVAGMLILALSAGASPLQAAPSFYGTTGLFLTPVAEAAPRGAWSAGANYVARDFRNGASPISRGTVAHCLTLTLLPRLELGAVVTNYQGKLGFHRLNHGLTPDRDLGGYDVDRAVALHWLALEQHGAWPALAFGIHDLFGTLKLQRAMYGVASLRRGRLTLSTGVGTQSLHGPFGGVQFALNPHVTGILEALRGQTNGGLRITPFRDIQIDAAFMGFRSLGGGVSYRRRL